MMHHRPGVDVPSQVTVYPVIETVITYASDGKVKEWIVPSCCWHDLWSATNQELAGMGLATLGNLIKLVGGDLYDAALGAKLLLKKHPKDDGIELPWPGMPDDRPLPLDLMKMPFQTAMFLSNDADFKWRVDRLVLMARIQEVWVPHLKAQMQAAHV